jgi:hypothetical protein
MIPAEYKIPGYFELDDLPKYIQVRNKIINQPFFGKCPDSIRYAIYYHPSMFWIYGNAKERKAMRKQQDKAWDKTTIGLTTENKLVAMGYLK